MSEPVINLTMFALLKKYVDSKIAKIVGLDPDSVVTEAELQQAIADLNMQNRIHRFTQSSISSAFSGPVAILKKEDLVNPDDEIRQGDTAIFPDSKSLVYYLGTISEINGEYLTVTDVTYLKDSWQYYGDWIPGVPASFPEVYRYKGGSWLCLVSDTNNPPSEGEEWKLLTAKIFRPTYYKLKGNGLTDQGVDQQYIVAYNNLTPAEPAPEVGDVVIFYTDSATYLGEISQVNLNGAIVDAKVKLGTILPDPTEEDEGKILGVQGGKLIYIDK